MHAQASHADRKVKLLAALRLAGLHAAGSFQRADGFSHQQTLGCLAQVGTPRMTLLCSTRFVDYTVETAICEKVTKLSLQVC